MIVVSDLLAFFQNNPSVSVAVVFAISLLEALLIVGLFVPSTAVLVGAGTLVGMGKLAFWPIFVAGTLGAIAGDALSFWLGRRYGPHLKDLWPLKNYPELVSRGESFFAMHGVKSIAIGRFVPAVKAIIPGIAGMMRMDQTRFAIVNALSAVVWAAAHILPGMLVGKGLSLVNVISPRLGFLLILLFLSLAAAAYVLRLAMISAVPVLENFRYVAFEWLSSRRSTYLQKLGELVHPDHPHALALLAWVAVLLVGGLGFVGIADEVFEAGTLSVIDQNLSNFLQSLRSPPGDAIMVAITLMGDSFVLTTIAVATIAWLMWQRAWYVAAVVAAAFGAATVFVPVMKSILLRIRPMELYAGAESFSFPSGHATLSATIFGILALLVSKEMKWWSRAVIFSLAGGLLASISLSRIYLLAHWPSDVVAGMAFGLAMTAMVGLALVRSKSVKYSPSALFAVSGVVAAIAYGTHWSISFDDQLARYAPPVARPEKMARSDWLKGGWRQLPAARSTIDDETEQVFSFQWYGSASCLRNALADAGWHDWSHPGWAAYQKYLYPNQALSVLPPLPQLQAGWFPTVTYSGKVDGAQNKRLVLRAWPSGYSMVDGNGTVEARQEILVGVVDAEERRSHAWYSSIKSTGLGKSQAILARLAEQSRSISMTSASDPADGRRVVLMACKS